MDGDPKPRFRTMRFGFKLYFSNTFMMSVYNDLRWIINDYHRLGELDYKSIQEAEYLLKILSHILRRVRPGKLKQLVSESCKAHVKLIAALKDKKGSGK